MIGVLFKHKLLYLLLGLLLLGFLVWLIFIRQSSDGIPLKGQFI